MSFNFTNPSRLFAWLYAIFCPFYGRKFYRILISKLDLKGDEHILDFGSGAGTLSKKLIKLLRNDKGQLTCLDTSQAFINKTRRKLRDYENVIFLLGNIKNLNIESNRFDIIISSWVLHHIPPKDLDDILIEFARCLKKGGKIFIIEYIKEPHGISEDDLILIFKNNGLEIYNKFNRKNTVLLEFKKMIT